MMVKSENSVMLAKDEFENLSKKWKPTLSAMFEVTTMLNRVVLSTANEEVIEVYDKLSPMFSQIHDNAVDATIKMIGDEFFN